MMLMARKRRTSNPWTPRRLKALRSRLGLTQAAAAAKVGVATRTWIGWENGYRTPSPSAAMLLQMLSENRL
jgi:DNA-binding transcriptional regulator YiaG